MSYEMLRFGWQKLLVNQVPQKGETPDLWARQWNDAKQIIVQTGNTLGSLGEKLKSINSQPGNAVAIVADINTTVDAKITEIDSAIAKLNVMPPYVFTPEFADNIGLDKGAAIQRLQDFRSSLARSKTTVPVAPTSGLTGTVGSLGNAFAAIAKTALPPPPPPPVIITPPAFVEPDPSTRLPKWAGVGQGERLVNYVVSPAYAANGVMYPSDIDVDKGVPYYTKPQPGVTYLKYTPPPPPYVPPPYVPTYYEVVSKEVEQQTKQLQKLNRLWNKPIDPAPPAEIYPTTSWQYEFWNKGYSLNEISFAETKAAQLNLLEKSNGDFALFKADLENILQDALLSKSVTLPFIDEVVPESLISVTNSLVNASSEVTSLTPNPVVYDAPGLTGLPLPKPVCDMPIPLPPNSNPKKMPRRRGFIPGLNTPVPDTMQPVLGCSPVATNTVPRKGNWEDALVGTGATVDELDTVRRMMASAKFANNANMIAAALGMLDKIRKQNGSAVTILPVPFVQPITNVITSQAAVTKAQEALARRQLAKDRALNRTSAQTVNSIDGVTKIGMSAPVAVKSNTQAKRQTTQAVRQAARNRR